MAGIDGIPAISASRERPRRSVHLDPGLRPEHPLLIGRQDQRLIAGHIVRLSADVPTRLLQVLRLGD